MALFTDNFQFQLSNCRQIQNAGISLYVSRLLNCSDEPDVYTMTTTNITALNATQIDLTGITPTPSGSNPVLFRNGMRLYFGALSVTIDGDQLITTPNPSNISIKPAAASIAAAATATTWFMKRILSPTNIPLTSNSNTVDRKDLTDLLQGSNVVTGKTLESAVQIITRVDDVAFWDVCFRASESGENIYAVIVRPEGRMAYGQAQVSNSSVDGGINEITRDQFTLMFQAPYAYTKTYERSSTVQKADMNTVASLTGLPLFA